MNLLGIVYLPTAPVISKPALSTEEFHTGHYSWHEGRARYTAFLAGTVASQTPGPVLDVGCGVGHFLATLSKLGIPATGFDVSQKAVDRAEFRSHAKVLNHDANQPWPFPDESFHAVTMFDVIEHFEDYGRALREAHRVLRSSGSLFMVTVNRNSVLRWCLGSHWGALRDPEHVMYFDRKILSSALRERGFEIRELRTFFNFSVAGESAEFLLPFRWPGVLISVPEFGDSIYVRAEKP